MDSSDCWPYETKGSPSTNVNDPSIKRFCWSCRRRKPQVLFDVLDEARSLLDETCRDCRRKQRLGRVARIARWE